MIAYFESSAFVKLLLGEPGFDDARTLFVSAARVNSSRLLEPEACAALARAQRAGRLGPRSIRRAHAALRGLLEEVAAIEIDHALAGRAGELAIDVGLRGYDAVHLASYELVEDDESVFVAADGDLARAALSLGHAVAVPG